MRLLLLSNSTQHGRAMLEHAEVAVREHLDGVSHVLFVPFALKDHDAYTGMVATRLGTLGVEVRGIHEFGDPPAAIDGGLGHSDRERVLASARLKRTETDEGVLPVHQDVEARACINGVVLSLNWFTVLGAVVDLPGERTGEIAGNTPEKVQDVLSIIGHVEVESSDRGATFTLRLPHAGPASGRPPEGPPSDHTGPTSVGAAESKTVT